MRRLLPVALAVLLLGAAVPAAQAKTDEEAWRESGKVVRILDGDTFDLATDDGTQRVRINGIQAPESTWCGGKEASDALRSIIPEGTEVRLASRKESSGNAPNGVWRLKRTVHTYVDGDWVDLAPALLEAGLVFPFPFIGEDSHNDEYLAAGAGRPTSSASACTTPPCAGRPSARTSGWSSRWSPTGPARHRRLGVRDGLQRLEP